VKRLADCGAITANDLCVLRELFHPEHDGWPVGYSLAHAVVAPGERTLRHHLEGRSEVYYLLRGRGRMHVDGDTRDLAAGDAVRIPPGAVQFIENTGAEDLEFLAIVDPAWQGHADHRDE